LKVTIVEDGRKAVEAGLREAFDLIFMDIQMPELNGYDAVKLLRESGVDTPIVALTAYAMAEDAEKCLKAGCDDYLAKPIDTGKLGEVLHKYLRPGNEVSSEAVAAATGPADEGTIESGGV
jgi:CheY-like chemotaxis protein